ncbi:MAG: Asp-tRNA(Asn)/Glu-tRNA(Gln) amidotransferase subunit GatB [Metamycoplasmataceae bacterium]
MNKQFESVIGIEIHLELNTKTKLFSSAENNFESLPNTTVSLIDLAFPGTLPSLNKEAVIKAIKLAKVLNMKIDNELHFDRKHYFYTDIPKCFQITQQFRPIAKNGNILIKDEENKEKKIRINRIHIEEDTARQIHKGDNTYINYNRAGVPLIEIVSEPDLRSAHEVVEYVSNISLIAKYLDISDAIMAKGSLRVDINLSTRKIGDKEFGTKVEIKNLNSLNNIRKAIELESEKQIKQILASSIIKQETKRFSEEQNDLVSMRVKDNNIDYKYFPEPNIPVVVLEQSFIDSINVPELPDQIEKRMKANGISEQYISIFAKDIEAREYFEKIKTNNSEEWAKVFFAEIVPLAKKENCSLNELKIKISDLQEAISLYNKSKLNRKQLKQLIPLLLNAKKTVEEIIKENNLVFTISNDELIAFIKQIITENKDLKDNYKINQDRCIKFVFGKIMQKFNGNIDIKSAKEIIISLLE